MLLSGIGFIAFAALVHYAHWSVQFAALIVGLVMVVLGLVVGERLTTRV